MKLLKLQKEILAEMKSQRAVSEKRLLVETSLLETMKGILQIKRQKISAQDWNRPKEEVD